MSIIVDDAGKWCDSARVRPVPSPPHRPSPRARRASFSADSTPHTSCRSPVSSFISFTIFFATSVRSARCRARRRVAALLVPVPLVSSRLLGPTAAERARRPRIARAVAGSWAALQRGSASGRTITRAAPRVPRARGFAPPRFARARCSLRRRARAREARVAGRRSDERAAAAAAGGGAQANAALCRRRPAAWDSPRNQNPFFRNNFCP